MQAETPQGELYKSEIYDDPEQLKKDKEKEAAAGNKVSVGMLLKKGEGVVFHGITWACFHSDQKTGNKKVKKMIRNGSTKTA